MRKALGCALLTATLASGLALPAHGLPTTDSASGASAAASALTPDAAAALRPKLGVGVRGPAVVFVQERLRVNPTSGYYGRLTEAAVRAWQRAQGLPVTGAINSAAWSKLLGPAPTTVPAADPRTAAMARPALKKGSRSPAVVFVQEQLGVSPATGYYGPLTKRAVTRLQKAKGLKATGTVNKATWKVLLATAGVGSPAPEPSPPPAPPAPPPAAPEPPPAAPEPAEPVASPGAPTPEQAAAARPTLRRGAGPGDPAVIFVQRYLKVTPATGYFGTLTHAAVVAYQKGMGISATGTVGPRTWAAIHDGRWPAPTAPTPPTTPSPGTIRTPVHPLPDDPQARDVALVFALAQVGKPYVLGGNGPAVFDCSGLVQQAYLSAGVRLPRLASQQRFAGVEVPIEDLLPGDLLYYQDGSSPRKGHISMYAGDGLVVEAANPRRGVRIRTLHEAWYRDRFVAAVRVG